MSSQQEPAVLIIHGAWTPASAMSGFSERLRSSGYVVECPQLPSCNNNETRATYGDDVATAHDALARLVDAGHQVLVLMHSYGGAVGGSAVTEDLYLSTRQHINNVNGTTGGVVGLLYVAAMMLQQGESGGNSNPGDINPKSKIVNDFMYVQNAEYSFFGDLTDEESAPYVSSLLGWYTGAAMGSIVDRTPWKDLPTTYLHTEKDLAMNPANQDNMIRKVLEYPEPRAAFYEDRLASDHFAFLGKPEETVEIVKRAWARSKTQ